MEIEKIAQYLTNSETGAFRCCARRVAFTFLLAGAVQISVGFAVAGDGLKPERRAEIFWQTMQETVRETTPMKPGQAILILGVGSWMHPDPDKRRKANDVDATVAYPDNDGTAAQSFRKRFNAKIDGMRPRPNIQVFDEIDGAQKDFYHGPTGQLFVYDHSKKSNSNGTFATWVDATGQYRAFGGYKTEEFWTFRKKSVPMELRDAHLFVRDNATFLKRNAPAERTVVGQANIAVKYVDRVQTWLREQIRQKWPGKRFPAPNDWRTKAVVGVIDCLHKRAGGADLLDLVRPSGFEKRDLMYCLGAWTESDSEFWLRVEAFMWFAETYFDERYQQVLDLERGGALSVSEGGGRKSARAAAYHVFLLTNASHGLYIGTPESLRNRTRCSFEGGGIDCKPSDVVTYQPLLGPFKTQAEAQAALCQNITERRVFPVGIGLKGRWRNSDAWYGLWDGSVSGGCR